MLRIGCVKYLNARPLIRGWQGPVDFDHPSTLCKRLANGELDVAFVSSFEFLRNPIYRIVDDVSISSAGPVFSVVVAHRGDISEVDEIELDPASETSVNLLRCLLAETKLDPRLVQRGTDILSVGRAGVSPAGAKSSSARRARLSIGDQAIRFRQKYAKDFRFWDLGEQWNKVVALPFVYALWLIRPEVVDPKRVANRLRALRDENLANLDRLIAEVVAGGGDPGHPEMFDHNFYCHYYRENLRFCFGEEEKKGLRTFAKLCAKQGLLSERNLAFDLV
jgi:predicted solute-binding protein